MMFGKSQDTRSGSEFRTDERLRDSRMQVVIDGVECTLLDYSEGGVRVRADKPTRRVALIEIYRDGRILRRSPATAAWRDGREVGYAFNPNLKIYEVSTGAAGKRDAGAIDANALRRRLKI